MSSQVLISGKVIETIDRLCSRIADRFPDSSILRVCQGLLETAKETDATIRWISTPRLWLRFLVILFMVAVGAVLVATVTTMDLTLGKMSASDLIQLAEATLNEVVLIGAAMVFLVTLENRLKRRRVIRSINKLRCIAHVIDMHQLTKDPQVVRGAETDHSPKRTLTPLELERYLDYCSEMVALTSKIAFLYIQRFDDPECVSAVNDLENLATGLARKIWQKIMLLSGEGVGPGQVGAPATKT